ncbi:MAG TPA: hypothetical protein OIM12_14445 [Faecalibacterium prausnitzii]|nr:hypothetical protein [Faecalibacterium prausnitzii]
MGNALVVPLVKAMGKRISALAEDEQTIENPALHLAGAHEHDPLLARG